jgi:hypothetical protein
MQVCCCCLQAQQLLQYTSLVYAVLKLRLRIGGSICTCGKADSGHVAVIIT